LKLKTISSKTAGGLVKVAKSGKLNKLATRLIDQNSEIPFS